MAAEVLPKAEPVEQLLLKWKDKQFEALRKTLLGSG